MSRDVFERLVEHTSGRCTVKVEAIRDYYPDTSCYGEFSDYRMPKSKNEKLVHLDSGTVLGHDGLWRDGKGRIASEPEVPSYTREYQYTFHDNGHDRIRYALEDSQVLVDLARGYKGYIALVGTCHVDGVELGESSIGGFEDWSGAAYLRREALNIGIDAARKAKEWKARNQ